MYKLLLSIMLLIIGTNAYSQINKDLFLEEINAWRAEDCNCGHVVMQAVNNLAWDDDLAQIANNYAKELYQTNKSMANSGHSFLSHIDADGKNTQERLIEAEYNASIFTENLAIIPGNEAIALNHWFNTPKSCKELMDKRMTVAGAARAGKYWVLLLAKPKFGKMDNSK